MTAYDPGCVKTLRGITAPGILGPTVTRRAKKRKNLSSARHYDQIRFRFHTAWVNSGLHRLAERLPLDLRTRTLMSLQSGTWAVSSRLLRRMRCVSVAAATGASRVSRARPRTVGMNCTCDGEKVVQRPFYCLLLSRSVAASGAILWSCANA